MPRSRVFGAALMVLAAVFPVSSSAQSGDENDMCWRRSFGRGAGSVPKDCAANEEKDGGLCYAKCAPGMKGVGPVCWSDCPAGFRDDGAFCAKPQPYGRGSGYAIWNEAKCRAENGGNCEKSGAMWYPACKPGFHATGCCVCSPDCPAGLKDIGVSCAKATATRGVGKVPACPSGTPSDGGLCYGSCPRDYDSVGPVCWGKCPAELPFACGAACAKSQAHCALAVTEMATETLSVASNLLLLAAGVPGAGTPFKLAAKQAAGTATKIAGKGGFRGLTAGVRMGAKSIARDFGKTVVKEGKNTLFDYRLYFGYSPKVARFVGLTAVNESAKELAAAQLEGQFDYTNFMMADPTGVSSLIYAFAKYKTCELEDVIPDVADIDFGPEPVKDTDVRTIKLKAQQPTTITEITTSPLKGCAIVPEATCLGKQLNPGDTCDIRVRVTGGGSAVGEIRVYTTAYDVVPMAFGVRSRGTNGKECDRQEGADEAVNLTSIAGVWAWNNDVNRKVVIHQDGTVQSFRGNGKATVVDPYQRRYAITIGSSPAETVELATHREALALPSGAPALATRRPWDAGCNPGEKMFAGLCYDLPVGYEPTAPGFMGKPCPLDWRDDGTRCYPPWTGVKVSQQADKDGTYPMRHPILVTDCNSYAQAKSQKCPANFKNTGGPVGCTCEAVPMSKDVKSIVGKAR